MQTPLIQPFTPQKEGPNTKQQPLDLHILKENYKKIKEERKEMKEKQRMDEKNKKETSQIFSYFPSSGSSVSELFEQNAIIDMYEEKILQNSIKSSSSFASIGSLSGKEDKSPKIIKKK